jgi:cytochrome c oxidase cbb3-type subunit 3
MIDGLIIFSLLFLSATNSGAMPDSEPLDGRELYIYFCSQCHGIRGKGNGINFTADMKIAPRDHTDAAFMSTRTDKQLEDAIKSGGVSVGKSPIMPSWEFTLSSQEIDAIVAYLRKLCNCSFEGIFSDEKLKKAYPDFR